MGKSRCFISGVCFLNRHEKSPSGICLPLTIITFFFREFFNQLVIAVRLTSVSVRVGGLRPRMSSPIENFREILFFEKKGEKSQFFFFFFMFLHLYRLLYSCITCCSGVFSILCFKNIVSLHLVLHSFSLFLYFVDWLMFCSSDTYEFPVFSKVSKNYGVYYHFRLVTCFVVMYPYGSVFRLILHFIFY